jgi:4-amino-4-deoxy-L-arabinose transferase-like glycosyltransferase
MKRMQRCTLIIALLPSLGVLVLAGNSVYTPWSGGGDTREYVEIAQHIVAGDGYTFAHQPTAFRAPMYPLLLASLMRVSSMHWPVLLRILQFGIFVATALMCGELAARWFGDECGIPAAALVLLSPTMLFFSGQILTECVAALLVVAFWLTLDAALRHAKVTSFILLGALAGLAALERFNMLPLIPFGALLALGCGLKDTMSWKKAGVVLLAGVLVLSPWIIHNEIAFHGQASYSTHGGFAAVEGVLMPLGRTQPGETYAIENALGWGNWDVETDNPLRPELRNEAALNKQASLVAWDLWSHVGWHAIPLLTEKVSAFWLSTDQILRTGSLSVRGRLVRRAGVAVYLIALVLAVIGWLRLRDSKPVLARSLILYALLLTIFHLPLTMNTRLRVPLFEPLICTLAACAGVQAVRRLAANPKVPL